MKSNLYIPKTIKVGFQKRSDTFTGTLAYVVYIDEKGVTRKETSWDSWRDKSITTLEIENKPQSGYVFNKGVQRMGGHFGSGRSVIRVYDPRDFEFEISVDNLIGILMNSDVSKRDIVESCVFAWAGKDLILLPTNSQEYKDSCEFTKAQSKKVSTRDLVRGRTYLTKKSQETLIYIGYLPWYNFTKYGGVLEKNSTYAGKKHVFYNPEFKTFEKPSTNTLAECVNEDIVQNYPDLFNEFQQTYNSAPLVSKFREVDTSRRLMVHGFDKKDEFAFVRKNGDQYINARIQQDYFQNSEEVKRNRLFFLHYEFDGESKFTEIEDSRAVHSLSYMGHRYSSERRNHFHQEGQNELDMIFGEAESLTTKEFLVSLKNNGYKELFFEIKRE